MGGCSVIGCSSRSEHKRDHISFHSFPSAIELKNKWIDATGRPKWLPTKSSLLCSIHFESGSFIYGPNRRYLKPFVTPTCYVHTSISFEDAPPRRPPLPTPKNEKKEIARPRLPTPKEGKKEMARLQSPPLPISKEGNKEMARPRPLPLPIPKEGNKEIVRPRPPSLKVIRITSNKVIAPPRPPSLPTLKEGNIVYSRSYKEIAPPRLPPLPTLRKGKIAYSRIYKEILQPLPPSAPSLPTPIETTKTRSEDTGDAEEEKKKDDTDTDDAIEFGDCDSPEPRGNVSEYVHKDIICKVCDNIVVGFRYTCVQCAQFELCAACEANQAHATHYMLRVPANRPHWEVLEMVQRARQLAQMLSDQNQEPEIIKTETEIKPEMDPLQEDVLSRPHETNFLEHSLLSMECSEVKEEPMDFEDHDPVPTTEQEAALEETTQIDEVSHTAVKRKPSASHPTSQPTNHPTSSDPTSSNTQPDVGPSNKVTTVVMKKPKLPQSKKIVEKTRKVRKKVTSGVKNVGMRSKKSDDGFGFEVFTHSSAVTSQLQSEPSTSKEPQSAITKNLKESRRKFIKLLD